MLTHFREAQSDLSSLPTAGDVFHQQPSHQANAVAEMADLVAQRLLDQIPPDATLPTVVSPTDTANALFQQRDSALAAREAALRSGAPAPSGGSQQRDSRHSRGRSGRSHNARSGGRGGRRSGSAPRTYCWSHGACAHSSSQCNTQLPGHQSSATFANMQGGSTSNCYWLPTWQAGPTVENSLVYT